jgi:hypothetical protein
MVGGRVKHVLPGHSGVIRAVQPAGLLAPIHHTRPAGQVPARRVGRIEGQAAGEIGPGRHFHRLPGFAPSIDR